jgi:hypothetical protein
VCTLSAGVPYSTASSLANTEKDLLELGTTAADAKFFKYYNNESVPY